ncbi:hypothetical protein [Qipengyuania sp.]|uniref:hypothetical protein n=1 Tax=Qipengyuania sp. TaxID=2004515 RepID=UPI0035C7A4BF
MKKFAIALAPLAIFALAACGETGESADIDMSGDAVAPGAGDGIAEAPATPADPETAGMESPAPEPFAPLDEQPEATPTPE